jgi:hypothetical protein
LLDSPWPPFYEDLPFIAATRLKPELFDACYFYARSCFAQGQMEKAAG